MANDLLKDSTFETNLERLQKANFGDHSLIIYQNTESFAKLYTTYTKLKLQDGDEIVVILPYYQTVDRVRQNLKAGGVDLFKSESGCSLLIIDAFKAYFRSGIQLPTFAKKVSEFAIQSEKKGISIFGDMGVFGMMNNFPLLFEYEKSLPLKFNMPLKGFCCYHVKDFESFGEDDRNLIMQSHINRLHPSAANCY